MYFNHKQVYKVSTIIKLTSRCRRIVGVGTINISLDRGQVTRPVRDFELLRPLLSESERAYEVTRLLGWNRCSHQADRQMDYDRSYSGFLRLMTNSTISELTLDSEKFVTAMFENIWKKTAKSKYQSDDGGKRARMTAINLRERDGLHGRLFDVRCSGYKRCITNAEQNIRSL